AHVLAGGDVDMAALRRRDHPLGLEETGLADAVELGLEVLLIVAVHFRLLILPSISRGGGPRETRWRGFLGLKRPLHHAAHGPPPLQRQGRISYSQLSTTLPVPPCSIASKPASKSV